MVILCSRCDKMEKLFLEKLCYFFFPPPRFSELSTALWLASTQKIHCMPVASAAYLDILFTLFFKHTYVIFRLLLLFDRKLV
jgi:hypothetical protein